MFSFLSASRLLSQRSHPVNIVLVSMFLLLLINPSRILDVGFQLSYSAVLAIITISPFFRKLFQIKNRVLRWIWEATMVSFAAQLGTLPLVIYYFHQVPVYALLTNLVAIPLLSAVIALFVISVPFMVAGIGAGIFSRLLVLFGSGLNLTMETIGTIPGSVTGYLYLDSFCTVMAGIIIIQLIFLLRSKQHLFFIMVMVSTNLVLFRSVGARMKERSTHQVIVANFYNSSLLSIQDGLKVDHYIWTEDPATVSYVDSYIELAWGQKCFENSVFWINGMETVHACPAGISSCFPVLPGAWIVGNTNFKVCVLRDQLDHKMARVLEELNSDLLLLSGEPSISAIHRDLKFRRIKQIIVDGSNREWYLKQFPDSAGHIYSTRMHGAYIWQYIKKE
jgi:hypothetical protein